MIKVYQTIIDKGHGNCMQAVVASLLELPLEEVPNFIEIKEGSWFLTMEHMFDDRGYDLCTIGRGGNTDTEMLKKIAKFDGGVNGFLYASVPSMTFEGCGHAVIVDTDLNIVHDPNPNQLALQLTADDIDSIMVYHDMRIGKTGKCFTLEQWDNLSIEEKDTNTYKTVYDKDGKVIGSI